MILDGFLDRFRSKRARALGLGAGLLGALTLGDAGSASACGCFTPPDPTVPVVQAGERILFAMDHGNVTAHIQIQYAGAAGDFGWLLPLPSVPKLEVGTDELFNQLIAQTQPKYRMDLAYEGNCTFQRNNFGAAPQSPGGAEGDANGTMHDKSQDVLVIQDSVGPYDYAVLRADSKQPMLDWLAANHYFVPAGTDDVVGPYVHEGAFFLALKLRSGKATGDLAPVVVHYVSDLPMIPIVLSSVASQKNMGIQVWMLGSARAIPRNYYHTVIDDAAIDWINAGKNYNDVIIRAAGEAPGHHTFVTEYAGPSNVVGNVLGTAQRYGDPESLKALTKVADYARALTQHGFPFDAQVLKIVEKYIPFPGVLAAQGLPPQAFYSNLEYWLGMFRRQHAEIFARYQLHFDSVKLTDELWAKYVTPVVAAGALFVQHPTLTRLYTTLSPEDMNSDPVFSFNPDLPPVSNVHSATLTYLCGNRADNPATTYAILATEQGFRIAYPEGTGKATALTAVPASRQIQILREAGPPESYADYTVTIDGTLHNLAAGCSVEVGRPARGSMLVAALGLLGGLFLVRRRRGSRA